MYYNIEEFNKILFDGFEYKLPENVISSIEKLNSEIEKYISSTADTSSVAVTSNLKYKKPTYVNNVRRNKMGGNVKKSEEDWETIRNFKPTLREKKEGNEKILTDIRVCLNKISNKNYELQRDTILEHINLLVIENSINACEENEDKINVLTIANYIFETASNNKFYSEIYADLYNDLIKKYHIFGDIIDGLLQKYKESIYNINYIDPAVDYNKHCEYNKSNDKRKAISLFVINLMKKHLLKPDYIVGLITDFQEIVFKYIEEENKTNEVEEITENLFILITNCNVDCKSMSEWKDVVKNVNTITALKSKDKPSITSRSLFKFMDILDFIKK